MTSPFKTEFAFDGDSLVDGVATRLGPVAEITVSSRNVRMANTLQFRDGNWVGREFDSVGMRAALREIELEHEPGTVALIGRGGVSKAVRDAIADSDWTLSYHTGARDGWIDAPEDVRLVVNASGETQFEGAPETDAWLDLHYKNTSPHPFADYYIGDAFFEAQAHAQFSWFFARR